MSDHRPDHSVVYEDPYCYDCKETVPDHGDEVLRKVGRIFIREWLREEAYREDWDFADLPSESEMRAALGETP